MNLLQTCNADVFAAIIQHKDKHPKVGEYLLSTLQKYEYWWQMTGIEMLSFANPMRDIWDGKIFTFYLLFESQQTTTMP